MHGRPLTFHDGGANITHGKRQIRPQQDTLFNNRGDASLHTSHTAGSYGPYVDSPKNEKSHAQNPNSAHKRPKTPVKPKSLIKPRNGIDIEPPRYENSKQMNHALPFPVVNGQMNRSNVRNNKRAWSKDLQADFVPPPMYNQCSSSDDRHSSCDIQGRHEHGDLIGFPRTRKKNFQDTLQPNRFIFREERNERPVSKQTSVQSNGKSNTYVIDPKIQNLHNDGTPCSTGQNFGGRNDHEILYKKRTNCQKMPPHTDFHNFSRTRQAYFDPTYIQRRAAHTLGMNPHRQKTNTPYKEMEEDRIRAEAKQIYIDDIPQHEFVDFPTDFEFGNEIGHERNADAGVNSPQVKSRSPAKRNQSTEFGKGPKNLKMQRLVTEGYEGYPE